MSEETKIVKLRYKVPRDKVGAMMILHTVREKRRKLGEKHEDEKRQENLVVVKILEMFKKEDIDGLRAKGLLASIKKSDLPQITNDREFYAHIKKTGEFDLLERRPAKEACRARWKAGKKIPGIGIFTKVGINLSKAKR